MKQEVGLGVIKQLDALTISQIAAGEVVTYPASVVKELVENSLDAGATRIEVIVRGSGQELISVCDNGQGIARDDLELTLARHATSKLADNDLGNICQLGFRGEAIAAVASVSRLHIVSRTADQQEAWQIEAEGGTAGELKPAAGSPGTTVTVRDLFYNTPARRKFLRSEKTERYRIRQVLKLLALVNPQVTFVLVEDERNVFELAAVESGDEQRIGDVMGKDFLANALPVQSRGEGLLLRGYIGFPTHNRNDARYQYLFVNRRNITDRLLTRATRSAYQDVLAHDKQPLYCLFWQLHPDLVDVNVHPSKDEVRFANPGALYSFTLGAIRKSLIAAPPRTSTEISAKAQAMLTPDAPPAAPLRSAMKPEAPAPLNKEPFRRLRGVPHVPVAAKPVTPERSESVPTPEQGSLGKITDSLGEARAQIHNTFIIAQQVDGMIIVDQHAAHERIVYEKLKRQLQKGQIASQSLLLPVVVSFDDEEDYELLVSVRDDLIKLGLDLEPFGTSCVIVRQVPVLIQEEKNWQEVIQELVKDLRSHAASKDTLERKLERCLAQIACRTSIKAGQQLTLAEMQKLLDQLAAEANTSQCNHGRPTHVFLSTSQLENLFQRR